MYIPVETPGGVIWAEVEDSDEAQRFTLTATPDKSVFRSFEETVEALKKNAQHLMNAIVVLAPDEVEVSFGIKVGVEAGVPLFGLAKATGEGSYTVTIKWKSEES